MTQLDRAFMQAIKEGKRGLAKRLLSQGADINARDADGWNALDWAAWTPDCKTIRFLVARGADVNAGSGVDTGFSLDYAVLQDAPEAVALLLESGAEILPGEHTENLLKLVAEHNAYEALLVICPTTRATPSLSIR